MTRLIATTALTTLLALGAACEREPGAERAPASEVTDPQGPMEDSVANARTLLGVQGDTRAVRRGIQMASRLGMAELIDPLLDARREIPGDALAREALAAALRILEGAEGETLRAYGPRLEKLYLEGVAPQPQLAELLARMEDPARIASYRKALREGRDAEIQRVAEVVGRLELPLAAEFAKALARAGSIRARKAVLAAALTLPEPQLARELGDAARSLLDSATPKDRHRDEVGAACAIVGRGATAGDAARLLRAAMLVDPGGHGSEAECLAALRRVEAGAVVDAVAAALTGRDEAIAKLHAEHPERVREIDVLRVAARALADTGAPRACPLLLATVATPEPLKPPPSVARRATHSSAYEAWSRDVTTAALAVLDGLERCGFEADPQARLALLTLYLWGEPYSGRFRFAGSGPEIGAPIRAAAARLLAELGLIDDATRKGLLAALLGKAVPDAAVRRRMATDVVTHLAIASEPGWIEGVWRFFEEQVERPDRDLGGIAFGDVKRRVEATRSAYALTERCGERLECYAAALSSSDPYEQARAVHALGQRGGSGELEALLEAAPGLTDLAAGELARAVRRLAGRGDAERIRRAADALPARREPLADALRRVAGNAERPQPPDPGPERQP